MSLVEWTVAGASVAGFSHQDAGTDCQDAYEVKITANAFFVCVVSDGAGSAPRSIEGARVISSDMVRFIAEQANTLSNTSDVRFDELIVRQWVQSGIELVREHLTQRAAETNGSLSDFHATMVGAVAGLSGGVFFHIGDGAACAARADDLEDAVVSLPENGEYANETFFVTEQGWRDHLRLTSFGPAYNTIALMSDGVTPFALTSGFAKPYRPFFEPLSRHLTMHTRGDGERALNATLQKAEIRKITGDDKTLVWALRGEPK
jgi:hypothetical protein